MTTPDNLAEQLEEQRRLVAWLQQELARQRQMNSALRAATADLARTFQAALSEVVRAGDTGDMQRVREVVRTTQTLWRSYVAQIIAASKREPPNAT
jgi:hypothetical protein